MLEWRAGGPPACQKPPDGLWPGLTSISCPGLSLLFVFQGVRRQLTDPAATEENVLMAWMELDSAAVR